MFIPGSNDPETLNGTDGADSIVALAGDDVIFDGNGNDSVFGGRDDDYLSATGLGDSDLFDGGTGYDMVSYANVFDAVTINLALQTSSGALIGIDTLSSIEYAQGSQGNDIIYGNRFFNVLDGREGDDALYGGGSNDDFAGLSGNDSLYGGSGRDRARYDYEDGGNGGTHGIFADFSSNIIMDSSGGTDTLTSIEDIVGSIFDDVIYGRGGQKDTGQNDISGDNGDDLIDGRGGIDFLSGNNGADTFRFSTGFRDGPNYDYVRDFEDGVDTMLLAQAVFSSVGGSLAAREFRVGASAQDGNDHIIYERSTGNLFYDADGLGGVDQILFAVLNAGDLLRASSFQTYL